MSQIRIVRYCIRPEIAEQFGLTPEECERVGVIAQEVEEILPDAIKENDDYLQVDEVILNIRFLYLKNAAPLNIGHRAVPTLFLNHSEG